MVRIGIAGGSGEVAQEIIDALLAKDRHDLLLLSRKSAAASLDTPNVSFVQVDYSDKEQLAGVLRGCEVVLSFITSQTDPGSQSQKNLIDACVHAGVKRFAPSEWATSSVEHMSWYAGKAEIREYLKAVNKNGKVLEYSLFQPGLFVNYLAHPHKTAKHVNTFELQFDFQNRRAIVPEGFENVKMTLTAAQDLANIAVKAIEYEGEWPVVGGIKGCEISIQELIRMGEDIRGGPFTVDRLKVTDLEAGVVKSTWLPKISHPAIKPEEAPALAGMFLAGTSLGISIGAFNVSDEWNQIFPEYSFVQPREFVESVWRGRP